MCLKDRSSSSEQILSTPTLLAKGAYISRVSLEMRSLDSGFG